jgi:hypothetical protein
MTSLAIDDHLSLAGKYPASPALEGGVKGYTIKRKYLTGKPRPSGREASFRAILKNSLSELCMT